jgi:hypothetical protein
MMYLHTKLEVPVSIASLVIAVKLKVNVDFIQLLRDTFYKENYVNKICIDFEDLLPHNFRIPFSFNILNGRMTDELETILEGNSHGLIEVVPVFS